MKTFRLLSFGALVSCAAMLAACGDDGGNGGAGMNGGACLPDVELECTPRYPPTFDNIYSRLIDDTCAVSTCHGPTGNAGNLTFGDADATYAALLNERRSEPLVIPGDPECSLLIKRLESNDINFVMPPRSQLDPNERCAIRQWIAQGAER
jgi:hypothetical protein